MLPHEIFYLIYNLAYILPVLYVYFFGFSEGGAGQAIQLNDSIIEQMIAYYMISLLCFFAGSWLTAFGSRKNKISIIKYSLSSIEKFIFFIVVILLVLTKILLYKEGVYNSYAFDSGAMSSKTWTTSMGLTELTVIIFIYSLFSGNNKFSFFLFLTISSNLLHGTRIFTLICIFIYFYYFIFYRKMFSKTKIIIYGLLSGFIVLLAFLAVFVQRSDVAITMDNLNLDMILSPVVYESIFNQISFVKMLTFLNAQMVPFAPQNLIVDTFIFSLPSFDTTNKALLMSPSVFGNLSPLGGLSGYASAIIYFSSFYFVWYFFLGVVCSLLWRTTSHKNLPLLKLITYVYFICDTLFRFNRDPWFIALKMLFNNLIFLLVVFLIMAVLYRTQGARAQQ